jgi:hypothetical protein
MGIQKGIIKLDGSVDGLTFYTANGKNLVRKSSGPTREQILYGENYGRTRENISEFGACSKIAKSFRDSLLPLKDLTDGEFGNRLTKLFKFVTRAEEGVRGKRPIRLSTHREQFRDFECNIHRSLSKAVAGIFMITHNDERTLATVTVRGGQEDAIESPAGATHFQFAHALGLVSDYIYNDEGYLPAVPALNRLGYFQYSDYLSLEGPRLSGIHFNRFTSGNHSVTQ